MHIDDGGIVACGDKKQVLVTEKCVGCQTLVREFSRCAWKEMSLGYEDFIKKCELGKK